MACGGSSSGPSDPSPTPAPTAPPGGVFDYNGITHVSWWHDAYAQPGASAARSALAATGGNWGGVLTTWYMDRRDSNSVAPHPTRSPTDDAVRRAVEEMHALGLKVMLKPHVDVLDGTWRGQIAPSDPGAWFASYAEMMDHFAAMARELDVEMLCVGTELVTMTDAPPRGVVDRGDRARAGGLPGAADLRRQRRVPRRRVHQRVLLGPQVDLLGLDVYTPLTSKTNPTRQELVDGWRRNRDGHDMVAAFRNFQAACGKPLIFTEVGYRSADGANRAPWDWEASAGAGPGRAGRLLRGPLRGLERRDRLDARASSGGRGASPHPAPGTPATTPGASPPRTSSAPGRDDEAARDHGDDTA